MFASLARWSLILTVILIAVGGSVRVTGAGLGCPDWPHCWGHWMPPRLAEEPVGEAGSGTITAAQARRHVEGLIAAGRLKGPYDPAHHAFNEEKMWIEYGNRLVGVLLGMVIAATALASLGWARRRPWLTLGAWAALVLVGFQGWLGALVVRSGLEGRLITVHMFCALLLLALLTWLAQASRAEARPQRVTGRGGADWSMPWRSRRKLVGLIALTAGVTMAQILLGSRVREAVGPLAGLDAIERTRALHQTGLLDHFHRTASFLVLGVVLWMELRVRAHLVARHPARGWARLVTALVLLQLALGLLLAYVSLPPTVQVLHLCCASGLVTAQLWLLFGTAASRDPSGYDPSRSR